MYFVLELLQSAFGQLKFDVLPPFMNKSKGEMFSILEEFRRIDHSENDAFVCCVLSHGSLGCIQSSDCEQIDVIKLMEFFYDGKCPTLKGKQKFSSSKLVRVCFNSGNLNINSRYLQINSGYLHVNLGYFQIISRYLQINSGYLQINSRYLHANLVISFSLSWQTVMVFHTEALRSASLPRASGRLAEPNASNNVTNVSRSISKESISYFEISVL